jgi:probable rRNA maturation factor
MSPLVSGLKQSPDTAARGAAPTVTILRRAGDWPALLSDAVARARRAARAALTTGRTTGVERTGLRMTIVLGDDALLQGLNRDWRGQDRPTNVLAFPAAVLPAPAAGSGPGIEESITLGDVIISCDAVRREAVAQGKTVGDHFSHLVVHGALHLLDYDHEIEPDACCMEALERRILAALDVADPYDPVSPALRGTWPRGQ